MPVASGAAGRVDAGVDSSVTWTSDRLKKTTKPPNRNHNSYLERYQELKKRQKNNPEMLQDKPSSIDTSDRENDGAKEESAEEDASREDDASRNLPGEAGFKKSQLCVIL
ncbi:hypothetical protein Q5P01_015085 [Channa striata]|uniref:Uncharacterized protein n=1 Tax=Channa striata TaxID=64152 RepID=A0AA88MJH5_CHASR|nr:hypothetical protein Q5P01_015085 [Channa striata]